MNSTKSFRPSRFGRLMTSGSLTALALSVGTLPTAANAQAFGTMVGLQAGRIIGPNGQVSVWTGANRPTTGVASDGRPIMTIEQTQKKALLDWEDFRLKTNEILEFQQKAADWIAVNRVHGAAASEINGEIRAVGKVYVFNDNGVLVGKDAKLNVRSLVTGRGVSDVNVDGLVTTFVQSKDRAILNWSDMSSQTGEVIRFQQEKNSWIALNRSMLTGKATSLNGDMKADGHLLLVSREGLALNGKIEAQQVIASSLDIRDSQFLSGDGLTSFAGDYNDRLDPTFTNSWKYIVGGGWDRSLIYATDDGPVVSDPNDPLRYGVTIGRTGNIATAKQGKVMLFGPNVANLGKISVQDEGQVVLAAGDNIYLANGANGFTTVYTGVFNPLPFMRANIPYAGTPWRSGGTVGAQWVDFINKLTTGTSYGPVTATTVLTPQQGAAIFAMIEPYVNRMQGVRADQVGFHARNEGIISLKRGGALDFRGWNLEQMGSVEMTSTALFRGAISFTPVMYDYREYVNNDQDGPFAAGNGNVVFGKGSLTQITPDLDSTDRIPVSSGSQSVGTLKINARTVHMAENALIYMPSGQMNVLLDGGLHVFANRGNAANQDNEAGSRFMMDRGAKIDLSGWQTTLAMGYNQVSGKLFAAQLADSPLQRDGALYRREISVDRRYGTNLADWQGFDNLSQGTLAQFLINGGSFTMDVDNDFIMKPGSVIDVSGGKITYQDGFVYTTLLRRLDGSVIDIREADPDELYMGLANEWSVIDAKWGRQKTYYIPLMSSLRGQYETSYVQGGNAGRIEILAPDTLLQGTLKGDTVIGRYQRTNLPQAGSFILNRAGESEKEYVSNNLLITANEKLLSDAFGMKDKLSDVFGDFFGEEYDPNKDAPGSKGTLVDNGTLASADFFNRSTMGSYALNQSGRIDLDLPKVNNNFQPKAGVAALVEDGVNLKLANGASLSIDAAQRMQFLGSVRTEGGDISLTAMSLIFGEKSVLDTRGSWYSDYELDQNVAIAPVPRINGGSISIAGLGAPEGGISDVRLIMPNAITIDASGGAWVDRNGILKGGKGGDLSVIIGNVTEVQTEALNHARAYGLSGNGAFSFTLAKNIFIGDALPETSPETSKDWLLLKPGFFANSGFSSIGLMTSGGLQIGKDVEVRANSAALQLKQSSLLKVPSFYYAPSGTDIYEIADIVNLTPAERETRLIDGMDISLSANSILLSKGSLFATETLGSLSLMAGKIDVAGSLVAPAGAIALSSSNTATGAVIIRDTGKLLAQGAIRVTSRGVDSMGNETIDGQVLDGGSILLRAANLTVEKGGVLDVSGTSARFHRAARTDTGSIALMPTTLASNGGSISLDGVNVDIDNGTYLATAGGAGGKGGSLSISIGQNSFSAIWPGGATTAPRASSTAASAFTNLRSRVFLRGGGSTRPTTMYGIDLNTIDWGRYAPGLAGLVFPADFRVTDVTQLTAMLDNYATLSAGNVPMLVIGSDLAANAAVIAPTVPRMPSAMETLMALPASVAAGGALGGPAYVFPVIDPNKINQMTHLDLGRIAGNGGFSELSLATTNAIAFSGNATVGSRAANGTFALDRINLSTGLILGDASANASLNANIVTLTGGIVSTTTALGRGLLGTPASNAGTSLTINSGALLQIESATFRGFKDVNLFSGGDIRLTGKAMSNGTLSTLSGNLTTPGNLTIKADQLYAATARTYTVSAGDTLKILPQDSGQAINSSPYEAGAILTLTAPRIVQGGTVRSPLGTINFVGVNDSSAGANSITLLPGSLTSVSADGKTIPYGTTANGDTWLDPVTGLELTVLPTKAVNLTADKLDLQAGAILDVKGGGDLYAWEFTPGIGGTRDWLTGYRDENYNWVDDGSQIFAVVPGYNADIAPIGLGNVSNVGVGEKIYLSGGSGLPAGYYTLLPARYALLPGAFRVTAQHHYGDYSRMVLGETAPIADGSSIQAGYRYTPDQNGTPKYTAQQASGYLVMTGETLRLRSQYTDSLANSFYLSEAFLKKALRSNRPVGDVPRIPLDGGSVVLSAGKTLNLDATLQSAAAKGGRGGFADIKGTKILVAGANTALSNYNGYLILDSERLNSFGAESLLLGGVRQQGSVSIEVDVGATDIVIDNRGSVLAGPELLFASTGDITVKDGARLETKGVIGGSSGDLRIRPSVASFTNTQGTPATNDDVLVHAALDQGAVLRLSSGEQVDILRNIDAVDQFSALAANPAALAAVNTQRVARGLAPLTPRGSLFIENGASLISSRSLALDSTNDTRLASGTTIGAKQISAAASRVSIGAVPGGTAGLVFAGNSLGTLAAADDILLKSYSSIDFFGAVSLKAGGNLTLDSRQIQAITGGADLIGISAATLTLTNTSGGAATSNLGSASLLLEGDNIRLEGQNKWISGVNKVTLRASDKIVGYDLGALNMPGALAIEAQNLTADSGAQLFLNASGDVRITKNGSAASKPFETLGATLSITGASIVNEGRIGLTGGTVSLRALQGDVTLAAGSSIDVTSNISQIFDIAVGVGGGTVNLIADRANIDIQQNAAIDVSGTTAGGDAGTLNLSAGLGQILLNGTVKGDARAGSASGVFTLLSRDIANFGALNSKLDAGGFRRGRRFEINQGDVTVDGTVQVQDFAVIANAGSINLTGSIVTTGDNGGRIQLSAAGNVNLTSSGKLFAKANAATGSGGTVFLETTGANGGRITIAGGSVIDVSGTGEGGRTVRLRGPQINGGSDLAIDAVGGTIIGARSVIAEGFRVYGGVSTIDQTVIDQVSADATQFMSNASAIQARLGTGITLAPGIELRSNGDMTLTTNWDLHTLRFGTAQSAGVLTLRAAGDLLINGNLSDGFSTALPSAALLSGPSWTFNLTAGANITSPDSLAVLPFGQLATGKGSLIIGGTPDTIEYFYDPAHGNENRLYQIDDQGNFIKTGNDPFTGFIELTRDAGGNYIDPLTGQPIAKDPTTGDYMDTVYYARRPLPWACYNYCDGGQMPAYGGAVVNPASADRHLFQQWDNSTGYLIRTGTGAINVATGRDMVFQERPSVLYTAGENAAPIAGFYAPANAYYSVNGGDLTMKVAGDILGDSGLPQLPNGWQIRRNGINYTTGLFAPAADRLFDQTTWYVNFGAYEAGVGALGGGNITIDARGDASNLVVNIPNSGRVTGNTVLNEATALHLTGGGNLSLRVGGDVLGGAFYVADGLGEITAGGAFLAGSSFKTAYGVLGLYTHGRPPSCPQVGSTSCSAIHADLNKVFPSTYALYPMLYTSSGEFHLQSGGDLNLDAVMDPMLYNTDVYQSGAFLSYTPDARVSLFSAGGDVTIWNNALNIDVVAQHSSVKPLHYPGTRTGGTGTDNRFNVGTSNAYHQLWPATLSAVAAAGDVVVLGQMTLAPAPKGNLELLAGGNIAIGYGTRADDPFAQLLQPLNRSYEDFGTFKNAIVMSQAKVELIRTATNPLTISNFGLSAFLGAGATNVYGGVLSFTEDIAPDLHVGDTNPVRIYAGSGNIVTTSGLNFAKPMWAQAGNNIYFPTYSMQHNNPNDLSLVRAGNGIYFANRTNSIDLISIFGPGRLELETGRDFWIPSNAKGITSNRITLTDGANWKPDEQAADIAVSIGYNQQPDYAGFEAAYLDPKTVSAMADYLVKDAGDGRDLPIYLFDMMYARGNGAKSEFVSPDLAKGFVNYIRGLQGLPPLTDAADQTSYLPKAWDYWQALPLDKQQSTAFGTLMPPAGPKGEFYLPEHREGLINYVRRLQGLTPLETQAEQRAYLDTAWAYWQSLTTDYKTPFYRSALFMELRTTGREANDKDNPRLGSTARGYDAIAALFPGAEKKEGASKWTGDFETYASRVISNGGGKLEFVIPGGGLKLASVAATPGDTGQPAFTGDRGNALRAGLITQDGGEINIFSHNSVTVNNSRILSTKGGNVLIWSSYGDIAAGKGAKTSISPQFYNYTLSNMQHANRVPAGLPTGAGIGTLATQDGSPPADVDLLAPNGIVDAGDAGLRVSGNFNVFALQILGTDNINVTGISTGLPVPPAAPPTSLDVGDVATKSNAMGKELAEIMRRVQKANSNVAPSIIEVRVTGYGTDNCKPTEKNCGAPPPPPVPTSSAAPSKQPMISVSYGNNNAQVVPFDIAPQQLDEAVRAVGRSAGVNILYDADILKDRLAPALRGSMTPEAALERLLSGQGLVPERVGPRTIMLRRRVS